MGEWQIRLFGVPSIAHAGCPIPLARRKQWALLSYLLLTGHAVPRELLATLLWPAYSQTKAHGNLRRELSRLRSLAGGLLRVDHTTVMIEAGASRWLDVDCFNRHWATAAADATGDADTACYAALAAARSLYTGDLLAGFTLGDCPEFEAWLFLQQDTYRERFFDVLERLAHICATRGDAHQAMSLTREQLALDPLYEAGHRRLMALYARTGQRAAAMHQYQTCAALLEKELQLEPAVETKALFAQLMAPASVHAPILPQPARDETAHPAGYAAPRFVGRAAQLAQLQHHLQQAIAGHGHAVFVRGEIGSGKTALLGAFAAAALARSPELLVVAGRGTTLGTAAQGYEPIRDAVQMLHGRGGCAWLGPPVEEQIMARLAAGAAHAPAQDAGAMPAMPRAPFGDAEAVEARAIETFTAALLACCRRQPLLFLVDNLQWTGEATQRLLFHLGKRLTQAQFLLLCACRSSELAPGPGLLHAPAAAAGEATLPVLVHEFVRDFGAIELDLDQIPPAEARAWVDALVDTEPNRLSASWRDAFYALAAGHPLFSVALLAHWCALGDLQQDATGCWCEVSAPALPPLPAQVEAALARRLDGVSAEACTLLRLASVADEEFCAVNLAEGLGWPVARVQRLLAEELHRRHGLLVESDRLGGTARGYRFFNPLLRLYLSAQLDRGELQLWQAALASGALRPVTHGGAGVDAPHAPMSISDAF